MGKIKEGCLVKEIQLLPTVGGGGCHMLYYHTILRGYVARGGGLWTFKAKMQNYTQKSQKYLFLVGPTTLLFNIEAPFTGPCCLCAISIAFWIKEFLDNGLTKPCFMTVYEVSQLQCS